MAVTITIVKDYANVSLGNLRGTLADVALDTSYPAGGYAIAASALALRNILGADVKGGNPAAKVLLYHWDTTNGKLMCIFPSGGGGAAPTSLANAAIATGATTVTSAAANGASDLLPGQGVEVGATANLSTITVRALF